MRQGDVCYLRAGDPGAGADVDPLPERQVRTLACAGEVEPLGMLPLRLVPVRGEQADAQPGTGGQVNPVQHGVPGDLT